MKKIFYFSLVCLVSFLFISPVQAQQKSKESIQSYEVHIDINKDNSIDVVESIEYDFGTLEKHGIYRNIPLDNSFSGENMKLSGSLIKNNLDIKDVKVTNKDGEERPFTGSIEGGEYKVKIGDPDETVTGVQTYNIKYTVEDVIDFYKKHDELYWNAIGSDWNVPIFSSKVTVDLPKNLDRDKLTIKCFVGDPGSKNNCDNQGYQNGTATFSHLETINPNQAFTVVVGFPKDIVSAPTLSQQATEILKDNWSFLIPPIALVFMLILWWKKGRDPKGKGNIVPQYEPPENLSPIEIGMLIDGKIDNHDISAQITHLANKGFLKIKYKEEDKLIGSNEVFTLIKKKDASEPDESYDQSVMGLIFGGENEVKLSDIKSNRRQSKAVKRGVAEKMVDRGYYKKSPNKIRGPYLIGGFFLAFGSFFIPGITGTGILSALLTGVIIGIVGWFMPSKTKEGVLVEEKILGFKKYLSVAEKERMDFHNAPKKKPEIFENYLPYAMALEVEDRWAEIFEDVYDRQPEWYDGPAGHAGAAAIASDMGSFDSAVSSSAASGASSTGGGSAGGGAGGGGGGSW